MHDDSSAEWWRVFLSDFFSRAELSQEQSIILKKVFIVFSLRSPVV